MFSQNNEENIILDFFKNEVSKINILDIGANDGITYSNSRECILRGASACLVEPANQSFKKLKGLYSLNNNVYLFNIGIGEKSEYIDFYESSDGNLASSFIGSEIKRWASLPIEFKKTKQKILSFKDFIEQSVLKSFDLILIDAEGMDLTILRQIDLTGLDCKMLIVEYNLKDKNEYIKHCDLYNYKLYKENGENLIFIKD